MLGGHCRLFSYGFNVRVPCATSLFYQDADLSLVDLWELWGEQLVVSEKSFSSAFRHCSWCAAEVFFSSEVRHFDLTFYGF